MCGHEQRMAGRQASAHRFVGHRRAHEEPQQRDARDDNLFVRGGGSRGGRCASGVPHAVRSIRKARGATSDCARCRLRRQSARAAESPTSGLSSQGSTLIARDVLVATVPASAPGAEPGPARAQGVLVASSPRLPGVRWRFSGPLEQTQTRWRVSKRGRRLALEANASDLSFASPDIGRSTGRQAVSQPAAPRLHDPRACRGTALPRTPSTPRGRCAQSARAAAARPVPATRRCCAGRGPERSSRGRNA